MSITISYPFDIQNNYIYDTNKISIENGEAKLKSSTTVLNPLAYYKLDKISQVVANESINDLHLAGRYLFDEDNYVLGKISNCLAGNNSWILDGGNIFNFEKTDKFTLECWIKFTSTVTQIVISKQAFSTSLAGYFLGLVSGKIRFILRDELANFLSLESSVNYNDNLWHHVVVTYNGSNNISGLNMYIDNTLDQIITGAIPLVGSSINTADFNISGRNTNDSPFAIGTYIDEIVIYNNELSLSDVSYRFNSGDGRQDFGAETGYAIDNPTIKPTSTFTSDEIITLLETVNTAGNNAIKFTLEIDGIDYYWDSVEWSISSGYSQSNTANEIRLNASSLTPELTGGKSIKPIIYLHSEDGTSTPSIQNLVINYGFIGVSILPYPTTIVFGQLQNIDNTPISGATIKVNLNYFSTTTDVQFPISYQSVVTDINGNWNMTLVPSDVLNRNPKYSFLFQVMNSYGVIVEHRELKKIPNTTSINYSNL